MKKLLYIIPILLVALAVFIIPARMTVATTDARVSINLNSGIQYADTPGVLSDWAIRFEPSGTHVKGGYLKVRLDFYPSESSKIYPDCYVLNEESGLYQLNPALCLFVRVPVSITKEQLTDYIKDKFNLGVVSTLDEILIQDDRAHLRSNYFNTHADKLKYNDDKAPALPSNLFIPQVNDNLAGLSVSGSGKVIDAELPKPGSISAGAAVINRAGIYTTGFTVINDDVKTAAAGTITDMEIWLVVAETGSLTGAMFTIVSGTTLNTTDSEALGVCASGSAVPFVGLTIACETSGLIGIYQPNGRVEATTSGAGGTFYKSGDQTTPDTETSYSNDQDAELSIYGTGTEVGGTPSISNSPSSKAFGVIWPSSTYWSNTGNSTGFTGTLDDAEAFFTLTNDGDTMVDVVVKATNFTGGAGCTLTHAAPGENTVRMSAFKEGDSTGDNVTLTTSDQAFISSLAASGNTTDWEIKLETGTLTDGVAKSSTITLTASAS